MAFFRKLFQQRKSTIELPSYTSFMGAGCVFTDGKHVLAGYQPHKKNPCITGIGGHREGEETYLETAYRETIEELFHVTLAEIPKGLIDLLIHTLKPRKIIMKKDYILVTFPLEDLALFLKICRTKGLHSPLYRNIPKTLLQLIQTRGIEPKAEISSLALLPVVKTHPGFRNFVHPLFVQDMLDM